MLSEFSSGLFDKAILQSGTAFADWTNIPQLNWAERLAKRLGWNGEGGTAGYYNFLKDVDAKKMVKEQEKIMNEVEKKLWIFSPYAPTIEPYVAEQSFFTRNPAELCRQAWGNRIPIIIGGNSEEGILWYYDLITNPSRYDHEDSFENLFSFEFGEDSGKTKLYAERTKRFYYGDEQPTKENISRFMDLIGDRNFISGISLAIKARTEDPNSALTYLYRFNFETKTDFTMIKKALFATEARGNL